MTHLTNNNLLIIESMNHIECSLVADEVIIKKNNFVLHELYINS